MNFLRVLLITLAVALPTHAQVNWHWTFEEHQLDIKEGGRMNSVAVNPDPGHGNEMFVASETGGLFSSIDSGMHWTHVDELPVNFTQSVAFLPGAVLVSAKTDFRKKGGGLWRRVNGQQVWTPVLFDTVPGERLSAYEISVQPGTGHVFVGTSQGVFKSTDGGISWESFFRPSSGDPTFFSVATDDRIFVAGPTGVWRLPGGNSVPLNIDGTVLEMHALAVIPGTAMVFVLNSGGDLLVFPNLGGILGFVKLDLAPRTGACNGLPFIKAFLQELETGGDWLHLYMSDRCGLYTLVSPRNNSLFTTTWNLADVDEDEPRDLAFDGNDAPALLGTTAGLHRPTLGVWHIAGGGREGGYNALQINEVRGQWIDGNLRPDLYIGTQDNKLWAWRLQPDTLLSHGAEGHFIELPRQAAPLSDCKMAFVADERTEKSEELFNGLDDWADVQGADGAPAMIRQGKYVQQVKEGPVFTNGLALTRDCGRRWEQFAMFGEEPRDLPKLARAGRPKDPVLTDLVYQAYRNAGGRNLLMRIDRPASATGGVIPAYPLMRNFGSLGINPTMFAWYQVYAIDPANPMHLIAADVGDAAMRESGAMRVSFDGGGEWTKMTDLTDKVLGTDFNFRAALNGPAVGEIFPFVTAVSFSPQDSRLVLAGTSEAGIFASNDHGQTWTKITGSERVTYVTSFYWETANTVFVSTYGRGLWKLRNRRIAASFEEFCGSCQVVSKSSAPVHGSALVFEGRVLGVRTSNRQLREVFVTPGSSVVFTGDLDDLQEDIAITVNDGRDTKDLEPLPKGPDGWVATGVVFTSDDTFTGAAFAETEMSLLPPPSGKQVKDSTESPAKGKPYIRLISSSSAGVAIVATQEVFELSATDFIVGASYEVLVDGVPIKGQLTADGRGAFTARITAPSEPGAHSVEARMAGDDTVIDRTLFLVRYRH